MVPSNGSITLWLLCGPQQGLGQESRRQGLQVGFPAPLLWGPLWQLFYRSVLEVLPTWPFVSEGSTCAFLSPSG